MGRRKRRKKIPRKPKGPPKIFECPVCKRKGITIELQKKEKKARLYCLFCHLEEEMTIDEGDIELDVYAKLVDKYAV